MATLQYRLSSRVSNGKAEVLVRFYDGEFSQRAKSHIYCPVSAWSKEEGMPVMPKRANANVSEISEARQKLDMLKEYVFSHWFAEQYDTYAGWLQEVVDDCFTHKKTTPHKNAP